MNETRQRAEDLFAQVLALPTTERQIYLQQACTADDGLMGEVEALLRGYADGEFLETSAVRELSDDVADSHIGRYKLLRRIGEGGCGIVYLAEQTEPVRRRVALKVIKLGMDTREVIARFEAERQALAMMDHPNIARVFDCGATEAGRPYFVMELVQGVSITQYCEGRRLAISTRLELFVSVCRAIQHAHEKGIVHRDIKPSNILVTLYDGMPVPKVIDFGVAKATEARLTDKTLYTAYAQFVGTPVYMSPEQADLGVVDARSDVYSLGVLLYELLTGVTPFAMKDLTGAGLEEMRRRVREEDPVRPSVRLSSTEGGTLLSLARRRGAEPPKLIAQVRGDLDWIVMRAVEKEASRRYATAIALAEDVGHHLRKEPVTAAAPGLRLRLRHIVRRHRVAGLAVAASLLAIAMAGGLWVERRPPPPPSDAAIAVSPGSVAVLPFVNLSPDPENAFFAEGVHEDVIMTLAKIHDLKVISRTSVMVYKNRVESLRSIATDLGVANILEGSVRRNGHKIRVTVQLVDARSDQPLWADSYDRDLTDVFAIQSDIAQEIAGALRSNLTNGERTLIGRLPTLNSEAYDLYLRGRMLFEEGVNQRNLPQMEAAVVLFEQAIAKDPTFAMAYARLALVHCELYRFAYFDPSPSRLARAQAAAQSALRINPQLPDAKLALGEIAFVGPRDYSRALAYLHEAEADLPNDFEVLALTGSTLQRLGHWDESLVYLERAAETNPAVSAARRNQVLSLCFLRRYNQAAKVAAKYLQRFPSDRHLHHLAAMAQYEIDGDRGAFLRREAALPRAPEDTFGLYDEFSDAIRRRDLAAAARALDDPRWVTVPTASNEMHDPVELLRAFMAFYTGKHEQARIFGQQALAYYHGHIWNRTQQPWALIGEAEAEAYMGDKDAAVRDARAAWTSVAGKDAYDAGLIQSMLGQVLVAAGENDAALAVLRSMLANPVGFYGPQELRWNALWSRLSGDPRFERILQASRRL